jgi:hypothetical protein
MPMYEIVFDEDGTFGAVYDDAIVELLRDLTPAGEFEIRKASDVEPVAGGHGFTARIRSWVPGGEEVLGPFPLRAEAVEAERAELCRRF